MPNNYMVPLVNLIIRKDAPIIHPRKEHISQLIAKSVAIVMILRVFYRNLNYNDDHVN